MNKGMNKKRKKRLNKKKYRRKFSEMNKKYKAI